MTIVRKKMPLQIHTQLVQKVTYCKPPQATIISEKVNEELFKCSKQINIGYRNLKQADDFRTFMASPDLDTSCEALVILITLLNRMKGVETFDSCQGLYHNKTSPLAPYICLKFNQNSRLTKEPIISILPKISYLLGIYPLSTYYSWSLQVEPNAATCISSGLIGRVQKCVYFKMSTNDLEKDPDLFVMESPNKRKWPLEISPEVRKRVELDLNTLALGFIRDYELRNSDS